MKWIRGQGGEGPRARSASGLITHASWWIINISSSRRLVGRAKWNERERERRHGREKARPNEARIFICSLYRSLRDRESNSNRWTRDRSLIGVSAKLGPNSRGGVPRPTLGSNDFRIPFSLSAPLRSRENRFPRSNLIVPPFLDTRLGISRWKSKLCTEFYIYIYTVRGGENSEIPCSNLMDW